MKKLKKLVYAIPVAITMVLGGTMPAYATSTVLIDTPNIGEWIGDIWAVANPLFNSVSGFVKILLGIIVVGAVIKMLLSR